MEGVAVKATHTRARRQLDARTETETLDRALAIVVAEGEIDQALRRVRGGGPLQNVFR